MRNRHPPCIYSPYLVPGLGDVLLASLFEHEAESHVELGSFINYSVIKFRCAPSTHSVDGRKPSVTERNIGNGVL